MTPDFTDDVITVLQTVTRLEQREPELLWKLNPCSKQRFIFKSRASTLLRSSDG